jgi:hypothetical protein
LGIRPAASGSFASIGGLCGENRAGNVDNTGGPAYARSTGTGRDRARLKADNQALFREVNDRIAEISNQLGDRGPGALDVLCECSRPDCVSRIALTSEEYDEVRASADTFVVLVGHQDDELEDVVAANERFAVVRLRDG